MKKVTIHLSHCRALFWEPTCTGQCAALEFPVCFPLVTQRERDSGPGVGRSAFAATSRAVLGETGSVSRGCRAVGQWWTLRAWCLGSCQGSSVVTRCTAMQVPVSTVKTAKGVFVVLGKRFWAHGFGGTQGCFQTTLWELLFRSLITRTVWVKPKA